MVPMGINHLLTICLYLTFLKLFKNRILIYISYLLLIETKPIVCLPWFKFFSWNLIILFVFGVKPEWSSVWVPSPIYLNFLHFQRFLCFLLLLILSVRSFECLSSGIVSQYSVCFFFFQSISELLQNIFIGQTKSGSRA